MAARVSQAQLERALGGADKLRQLADTNKTGNIEDQACQSFIEDVLEEGNGEVNSYVALAIDLSDPLVQTAPILLRYELAVDVYLAWSKGTGGIAVPDKIQSEYEKAIDNLKEIADRKKGLGLPRRPASSQPIQQVTKSDSECFFNFKGPRGRYNGWS